MFKCESCKSVVWARQPQHEVVISKREKRYPRREKANYIWQDGKEKYRHDEGGKGWEIVESIRVCPDCYEKLTGQIPMIVKEEKIDIKEKIRNIQSHPPRNKYKESKRKQPEIIRFNKKQKK